MKKLPIIHLACAITSWVILACGLSANAQTILYQDNFNVANGNLDSASLSRLSGTDAGLIAPQSGGSQQVISGNQLSLTLGGGATTSEMRFDNVGQSGGAAPNLFDWSAGSTGAAITAAGGMQISFNWTAGDTTSGNWIFLALGNGGDISYNNLRILNSTTESGILFKNSGASQIFNNGASGGTAGSYTPSSVNHLVTIDYNFNSWAAGAPVTMSAIVDGNLVGTDTFNWNATSGQYLDIGTYGNNNNLIDNFMIATAPEPTTWALVAGGAGLFLFARRPQNSRA